MKGCAGKILHVDLTSGKIEEEKPDEKFYRKYFGGACMGAYYVMQGVAKGTDPLSPGNVLAFTISPLTGAALSGEKMTVKYFPGRGLQTLCLFEISSHRHHRKQRSRRLLGSGAQVRGF